MSNYFSKVQLTASAGIAPNKFLAKIASDWNKPNGLKVIPPQHVEQFIKQVPVQKICGVGPVTAKKLHSLHIYTCLDLQKLTELELTRHFGQFGSKLYRYARGIDHRPVTVQRTCKSISIEETFAKDLINLHACYTQLPKLINNLNSRLAKKQDCPKIYKVFVKLKFHDFVVTTVERISDTLDINLLKQLLHTGFIRGQQKPIRLLGIGIRFKDNSQPVTTPHSQLSFDF